jgi:8-oxo-dGTP diphosphatase
MPTIVPEYAAIPAGVLHVAVGVVINSRHELLVTQRAAGTHLEGYWELPGGKVEAAETVEQALSRELKEELGIEIGECRPLLKVQHRYPQKPVLLDTWRVLSFRGEPHGREGQPLRWVPLSSLSYDCFPAADRPIIDYLCERLLAS